jgi:LacI family transcriptional regulator, repressor for deo operon, udp, cdd, tsx, nupC, and nupG
LSACGQLHDGKEKAARLVDLVCAGQADGVVLLDGRILRGPVWSLAEASVPIVGVSLRVRPGVPAVLVEERAAAVARHLLKLGHRRFGYVSGPAAHYIERERWAGFRDTLAAAGTWPRRSSATPATFTPAPGSTPCRPTIRTSNRKSKRRAA